MKLYYMLSYRQVSHTRVASSRPMLMFGRFTDDAIFLSEATDAIFLSDMAPDAATGLGAIECEQTHGEVSNPADLFGQRRSHVARRKTTDYCVRRRGATGDLNPRFLGFGSVGRRRS